MEKMEVDDVVDLSLGSGRESLTITPATTRNLLALTENYGLTITPAPLANSNNQSHQQQNVNSTLSLTTNSSQPAPTPLSNNNTNGDNGKHFLIY